MNLRFVLSVCIGLLSIQVTNASLTYEIPFEIKRKWQKTPEFNDVAIKSITISEYFPSRTGGPPAYRLISVELSNGKVIRPSRNTTIGKMESQISPADQAWCEQLGIWLAHRQKKPTNKDKALPTTKIKVDRKTICSLYPGYEVSPGRLSGALAPFLMWWDHSKLFKLDTRKDDILSKREEAFRILDKTFSQKSQVTSELRQVVEDCNHLFSRFYQTPVKFSSRELTYVTPEILSYYTRSTNATLLWVIVYVDGKYSHHSLVPVGTATPDGQISIIFRGAHVQANFAPISAEERIRDFKNEGSQELKIQNPEVLAPHYIGKEVRLFLEPARRAKLWVISPNKLTPGVPLEGFIVPPIPPMDFSQYLKTTVPTSPQPPKEEPAGFDMEVYRKTTFGVGAQKLGRPISWSEHPTREWKLIDGTSVSGKYENGGIRTATQLLTPNLNELSKSDQTYMKFCQTNDPVYRKNAGDPVLSGMMKYEFSAAGRKDIYTIKFTGNQLIATIYDSRKILDQPDFDEKMVPEKDKDYIMIDFKERLWQCNYNRFNNRFGGRLSDEFLEPGIPIRTESMVETHSTVSNHKEYPCKQCTKFGHVRYSRMNNYPLLIFWRIMSASDLKPQYYSKKFYTLSQYALLFYHYDQVPMAFAYFDYKTGQPTWKIQLTDLDLLSNGPEELKFSKSIVDCKPGETVNASGIMTKP